MLGILGNDVRCPIARSLDVLGEKWTLMIVRDALAGATRFSQFQSSLGLSRDILTDRLDTLVTGGVLVRRPYKPASGRTREEYALTAAGRDLALVLMALGGWADRHRPALADPTLEFVEIGTGQSVDAVAAVGTRVIPGDEVELRRRDTTELPS